MFLLPKMFGMRQLGARSLTLFSLVYCFNRAYRGNAMPHQLEALKLAERTKRVVHVVSDYAILLAVVSQSIDFVLVFVCTSVYKSGAWEVWYGSIFRRTQSWLTNPAPVDVLSILAMCFGAVFTFLLTAVRTRFVWWPLYPVGYGISGTWAVNFFWFSVFISWIIKWCILRFGGLKTFRNLAPFFLGLILGEFLVGGVWALIGVVLEKADVSVSSGDILPNLKDWALRAKAPICKLGALCLFPLDLEALIKQGRNFYCP